MAPRTTVLNARKLRRAMTLPEVKLWQVLRSRPDGVKFRRQHPIGRYILDFYCADARLAIEVDGAAHDAGDNPARDKLRDQWLADQGIKVLRVAARAVLADLEIVLRHILERCAEPLHHPADGPPPHAMHGED